MHYAFLYKRFINEHTERIYELNFLATDHEASTLISVEWFQGPLCLSFFYAFSHHNMRLQLLVLGHEESHEETVLNKLNSIENF